MNRRGFIKTAGALFAAAFMPKIREDKQHELNRAARKLHSDETNMWIRVRAGMDIDGGSVVYIRDDAAYAGIGSELAGCAAHSARRGEAVKVIVRGFAPSWKVQR